MSGTLGTIIEKGEMMAGHIRVQVRKGYRIYEKRVIGGWVVLWRKKIEEENYEKLSRN